jgi:hypothetical protein
VYIGGSTFSLANNTVANNVGNGSGDGVYIGGGGVAELINNLILENGYGIRVSGGQVTNLSHNAVTQNQSDNYAGVSPGASDISDNPVLVNGLFGKYYLQHVAAGQGQTSPLVDAGEGTAASWNLDSVTTRTDGEPDQGPVDVGHHYPAGGEGLFIPLILVD